MNTTADRQLNQLKAVLDSWFQRSVSRRQSFDVLAQLAGPTSGKQCLCVVAEDMLVSSEIAARGGNWEAVSILDPPGPVASCLFGDQLHGLEGEGIPFPDQSYDLVLLEGAIEFLEDDAGFIMECHRVLKPSGQLIIRVPLLKQFSLLNALRRLLGLDGWERGRARKGYQESDLFAILKDGFDIEHVRSWSRFFSVLMETMIQTAIAFVGGGQSAGGYAGDEERTLMNYRRVLRLQNLFCPFGWLARSLDGLLFFTRGYVMAVSARQRAWKARVVPELKDGRSIADAAINTKIGTAGPF